MVSTSDGELMNLVQGYVKPRREDKPLVVQGRRVRQEVQLKGFMAAGAGALTREVMKRASEVYDDCQTLGKDNPAKAMIMTDIMSRGIGKMMAVQESLYDGWRL